MPSKRCSTPEYSREYWKFKRHLDYYLREAFASHEGYPDFYYTESQIIDMLFEKTGFRVKPETLSKALRRLLKDYGESPLEPFYRVNIGFFEKHPPKSPKHYHKGSDEQV
jgi:hypothetical protein